MRRLGGLLLSWGLIITMIMPTMDAPAEVVGVSWEKIPKQEVVHETRTMPARTHDVRMYINEFTYEEAQLLLKIAEAEAGNQGPDGMWLVMSVVFNRVQDPSFPSTVQGVVYEPHQFSSVSNGMIDEVEITADAHKALARVEIGDVAPSIIGFETTQSTELDKYFCEVFTFKDHKFYVERNDVK